MKAILLVLALYGCGGDAECKVTRCAWKVEFYDEVGIWRCQPVEYSAPCRGEGA